MNRKVRKAQLSEQWFKAQWYFTGHCLRQPQFPTVYHAASKLREQLLKQWLDSRHMWA